MIHEVGAGVPIRLALTIRDRAGLPVPAAVVTAGIMAALASTAQSVTGPDGRADVVLPGQAEGFWPLHVRIEKDGAARTAYARLLRVRASGLDPLAPPPAAERALELVFEPDLEVVLR
jgi:hypothetical protein